MPEAYTSNRVKTLRRALGSPEEVAEMLDINLARLRHVEAYGGPDTTLIGLALRQLAAEAEQKPKKRGSRKGADPSNVDLYNDAKSA